jgi:N-ethylmaleimide reductase
MAAARASRAISARSRGRGGDRGSDRVGVRLSPVNAFNDIADSAPQRSFNYFAEALGDLRPAYLHAVETHNLPFDWAAFRRAYKGAYIASGGYDLAKAEAALDRGDADLVSFGLACRLSLIPTS